jgi:hypothetical protein
VQGDFIINNGEKVMGGYQLEFNEIMNKYYLYKNDKNLGPISSEQVSQVEDLSERQHREMQDLLKDFKNA